MFACFFITFLGNFAFLFSHFWFNAIHKSCDIFQYMPNFHRIESAVCIVCSNLRFRSNTNQHHFHNVDWNTILYSRQMIVVFLLPKIKLILYLIRSNRNSQENLQHIRYYFITFEWTNFGFLSQLRAKGFLSSDNERKYEIYFIAFLTIFKNI